MTDMQQRVEALAERLRCPVLIEDARHRPLWWNAQGQVDEVRSHSILERDIPPAAAALVSRLGLAAATNPVRTPALPEADMAERWCAPLRDDRELLGYLWVIDAHRQVGEADLDPVLECARHATIDLRRARLGLIEQSRRRDHLLLRLCEGPDNNALRHLIELEELAPGTTVAVGEASRRGSWPLPHDLSAELNGVQHDLLSGSPVALSELHVAVARARATRRALAAGAVMTRRSWESLGAWRLIVAAPDDLEPRHVHPGVTALSSPRHSSLLRTARCVLDMGGDAAASADRLHIHRSTLYYRLDRIAELTGVNLRGGQGRDDLHTALRLAAYRAERP